MGKHYRDPADKPALIDLDIYHNDRWNNFVNHPSLFELCRACILVPATGRAAENDEGLRRLFVVEVPENIIALLDKKYKFYLTYAGAKAFLTLHNNGKVNKANNGNKRKARLLIYTPEEIQEYHRSLE